MPARRLPGSVSARVRLWPILRLSVLPWAPRAADGKQRAHPIRYIAELVGADADSERIIRWLIALMVLCFEPLAIALTAAASARRQT